MKKQFYLFATALLLSLFMSVSAKADNGNTNSNSNDSFVNQVLDLLGLGNSSPNNSPNPNNNCPPGSTQLPINNGVVFLAVAGIAIGIVTLKKAKNGAISYTGE